MRYSSKVRYFLNKLKGRTDLSKSYERKTFLSWIIFQTFKWDIAIALLLAVRMQVFEYSTAFFIQQILAIKHNFEPDDRIKALAWLSAGIVVWKVRSIMFFQ